MDKKVLYKENNIEKEINFDELNQIDGIEILEEKDITTKGGKMRNKIVSITPLVCVIIYLLLGFYKDLWHPGWVIFALIPIVPMFLDIFSKKKGITNLLTVLIVVAYIVLGFLCNWWHPGWIIFLLIPIVNILFGGKDD